MLFFGPGGSKRTIHLPCASLHIEGHSNSWELNHGGGFPYWVFVFREVQHERNNTIIKLELSLDLMWVKDFLIVSRVGAGIYTVTIPIYCLCNICSIWYRGRKSNGVGVIVGIIWWRAIYIKSENIKHICVISNTYWWPHL